MPGLRLKAPGQVHEGSQDLIVKMIVKIHPTPNGRMLAICDSDILGKKFEEGDRQLDLAGRFYHGKETSKDEIVALLRDVYIINAVGKESVGFLVEQNMVDKEKVLTISGVPYAQCLVEH